MCLLNVIDILYLQFSFVCLCYSGQMPSRLLRWSPLSVAVGMSVGALQFDFVGLDLT